VGYGVVQMGVFGVVLWLSAYGLLPVLGGLIGLAVMWFVVDRKVKLVAWDKGI
jgi:hypothetical protein